MWLQNEWHLTAERVAIHQPSHTAVLADMHLGYVAARRGDGEAVPHFGETERLDYLVQMLTHHQVKCVVVAGDIVESAPHGRPLVEDWARELNEAGLKLHLVPGNHDRGLLEMPNVITHPAGYPLGHWLVVHDADVDDDRCLIHGHLHPMIRTVAAVGEAFCYLTTPNRLLLPAWCDHASGVNVLGMEDWQEANCFAIAGEQVVSLGSVAGLAKKLRKKPRPFRIGFGLSTC
jgi:metallophosphoesterase superfamily enzyme